MFTYTPLLYVYCEAARTHLRTFTRNRKKERRKVGKKKERNKYDAIHEGACMKLRTRWTTTCKTKGAVVRFYAGRSATEGCSPTSLRATRVTFASREAMGVHFSTIRRIDTFLENARKFGFSRLV